MAKQPSSGGASPKFVSRIMGALARSGAAPKGIWSLAVPGRTSGQLRTVPVSPVEFNGIRYLVAPYGVVDWVRNLRAAGAGELRRGGTRIRVTARELTAEEAAPVLKHYVTQVPITRPYLDVTYDRPAEEFAAIAAKHPVFELREG